MNNKTIIDFLYEYAKAPPVSFHMPGHKGRRELYVKAGFGDFLQNILSCDITEIPGADALFCPETTLRSVMDNYADLYGAVHSELLVNGSSAGVMAAVIGSVPVGGKLILGRNSHHSAFSALCGRRQIRIQDWFPRYPLRLCGRHVRLIPMLRQSWLPARIITACFPILHHLRLSPTNTG